MDSGDPAFLALLLSIGRDLTEEDFENLKFLCEGTVPASHLETVKRPRELFLELIHCCDLSDENKDPLSSLLFHIGRHDLKNRLLGVEGKDKYVHLNIGENALYLHVARRKYFDLFE